MEKLEYVLNLMKIIEGNNDIRNYQSRWRRLKELLEEAAQKSEKINCPSCTWRGEVELVNGVCPQCDTNWKELQAA